MALPKRKVEALGGRRRLAFGPGLLLAVIASLLVWQFVPHDTGKPIVERTPLPATETTGLSAPEPAWLSSQRSALGLTSPQVARLDALRAQWEKDTQPLRVQLDAASTDFAHSLPASDGRGAPIQQVRDQATPVSELTRQLLDARRAWWNEAAEVLTPAQKRQAEQAWAQRFSARPGGGK